MDVTQYNDGKRGGRIKVRAKIDQFNKNTLVISQIPYTTTSSSLIESILKANDKGKIKVKKIEDNTSSEVEILIHLPSGVSPDKTIDALFAFTNCEVSISPLSCIIENHKPIFIGVNKYHTMDKEILFNFINLRLLISSIQIKDFPNGGTLFTYSTNKFNNLFIDL